MFGPMFTIHFLNFEVENSKFYHWGKLYQILISTYAPNRVTSRLIAVAGAAIAQGLEPSVIARARVLSRRPKEASGSEGCRGSVVNSVYVSPV